MQEKYTRTNEICQGCGACCAPGIMGHKTEPYLEVTAEDTLRGFKHKAGVVSKADPFADKERVLLRVVRAQNDYTQCEHLQGIIGQDAKCGCYDSRPTACRIYEPGSTDCQRLRQLWLAHRERKLWLSISKPELSEEEQAYQAARAREVDEPHSVMSQVMESLGKDLDYFQLRRERDKKRSSKMLDIKFETVVLDDEKKSAGDEQLVQATLAPDDAKVERKYYAADCCGQHSAGTARGKGPG